MYKGNCHLLLKPDIKEFLHTTTKKKDIDHIAKHYSRFISQIKVKIL